MITLVLAFVASATEGTVTVPLEVYDKARAAASPTTSADARSPAVGSARWRGEGRREHNALRLTGELRVDLGDQPGWKEVPVLGRDAVLLGIEVGGRPEPVGGDGVHHTWRTDRMGPQTLVVEALVGADGNRGSLQYDVAIPRTPITRVELDLPQPDLRPEVTGALRHEISHGGGRTRLTADLVETNRLKVVGLRDLGGVQDREPQLFAEGMHLVSVEDDALEVFSVLHYNILYAGATRFDVFVPEPLVLVSADGLGTFRTELVDVEGGKLVKGSTEVPIRNAFEVSLRLRRPLAETIEVGLPTPMNVARAHTWVGVEVAGRVRLQQPLGRQLTEVDPRQLPLEIREASVSPILAAWRGTDRRAGVTLEAQTLPEWDVHHERIDALRIHSTVSSSGQVGTTLTVTLRNQRRHALTVDLPEGWRPVRARRNGSPVPMSERAGDHGRQLVVPLRRTERHDPIVLELVFASKTRLPRWWGRTTLDAPAVDLPVAALTWTVTWPEDRRYGPLTAPVASQHLAGSGQWLATGAPGVPRSEPVGPTHYERYWVPADSPMSVSAVHVAGVLRVAGWGIGLLGATMTLIALVMTRRR